MKCKDFEITADRIGQVIFLDTTVFKKVAEREDADKKKKKP